MKVQISPAIIVLVASCILFCGCGTGSTTMSKQDVANFHGGPMPAGIASKIAQQQADLQKSQPAAYKNWLAQRQADLTKRRGSSAAAPAAASNK